MDYREFSADVTATTAAKRAIDDFAEAQTDGVHFCPRCGHFTVNDKLDTNTLSRHVHVYICDECGTDEATRELHSDDLPIREWAVAKLHPVNT